MDNLQHMRRIYGDQFVNALVERNRAMASLVANQARQTMVGSLPRSFDPFERPVIVERNALGDEWNSFMNQLNRAFVSPEGAVLDDMSAMAVLRDEKQRQRDLEVQRVTINPASARNGVLGGAANMPNGAPPQRLINWVADSFEEAMPLSIFVGPISTDVSGNFGTAGAQNRAYANVYWLGGRGVPMSARVDVGKGRQFNLHGSFVAVDVGLDTGNASGSMNLGSWLSFRPTYRSAPQTTTMFVDALANGGTQTVIIPSCATGLLPVQATTQTVNLEMQFRDRNGTVVARVDLQALGQQVATLPMGDDFYDVLLTNNDANPVTARLVFELCF